jgi:DNA-directed RNA polymerase subunit alpha
MSNYSIQLPGSLNVEGFSDTNATFILEPLEQGFGVTIGNSLRRVLLSSLPGIAIHTVKIEGVEHEYSSIDGVKEDVYEIILNLKEVRFGKKDKGSGTIHISKSGKGTFTAKDIGDSTTEFSVLNPDLVIANLSDSDTILNIEMQVSQGMGYVLAEDQTSNNGEDVALIPIDAIYTPVKKVKFNVENVRVGQRTDYEKLIMEVTTDGSINPREAITMAGKILKEHIEEFIIEDIGEPFIREEEQVDAEKQRIKKLLKTNIEDLNLSVRSFNCLKSANIDTIAELVEHEEDDLLKFRNFGKKSLTELVDVIEEKDLHFGMDISNYLDDNL